MKKSLKALPLLAASLVLSAVVPAFAQEGAISVVTREDGSGTRGAFVEIVGVEDENGDDYTTLTAVVQNGTNQVMQTVEGDPNAIGYISTGSLNESIKALAVDGAEPTAEAIASGDYPIQRPFLVAWNDELSEVAEDFLTFVHSAEGQTIVEGEGYIAVAPSEEEVEEEATEEDSAEEAETEETAGSVIESLPSYEVTEGLEGTVETVGSTSVSPLMEKLAEEYMALNQGVQVNVISNGSSAGIEAAISGTADFGMSSRALTDEEIEQVNSDRIAVDGIAIIVNNESSLEDITLEAVRGIFLGEITSWEELAE